MPFWGTLRNEGEQNTNFHKRNAQDSFHIELHAQDKNPSWKLQAFPSAGSHGFLSLLYLRVLLADAPRPWVNASKYTPLKLESQCVTKPCPAATILTALPSSQREELGDPSAAGTFTELGSTIRFEKEDLAQSLECKEGKEEVEIDFERQLRGLPTQRSGGNLRSLLLSEINYPTRPVRAGCAVNSSPPPPLTPELWAPLVLRRPSTQSPKFSAQKIQQTCELVLRSTPKKSDKIQIY